MQYSKKVIEHFKNPHNQGKIKNADAIGQVGNPACGDVMKIYLKIKDNAITNIKFETLENDRNNLNPIYDITDELPF